MRQLIGFWSSKIYHCHLGEMYGRMTELLKELRWRRVKALFWLSVENKDMVGRVVGCWVCFFLCAATR